jgi:hypothetical protein
MINKEIKESGFANEEALEWRTKNYDLKQRLYMEGILHRNIKEV